MGFFKIMKNIFLLTFFNTHSFSEEDLKEIESRKQAQEQYKKDVFNALVQEKYTVNHLNHYFIEVNGRMHVIGIVELVGAYGYDLFRRVEQEREIQAQKAKRIKKLNTLVIMQPY